jgi:hypothetical protein
MFNTVMGEFNIGAIEEIDLMRSIKLWATKSSRRCANSRRTERLR